MDRLGFLNLKEDYLETAEQMFDNGISQVDQQGFITAELWYGKVRCFILLALRSDCCEDNEKLVSMQGPMPHEEEGLVQSGCFPEEIL